MITVRVQIPAGRVQIRRRSHATSPRKRPPDHNLDQRLADDHRATVAYCILRTYVVSRRAAHKTSGTS
jgi:hypothetical protein